MLNKTINYLSHYFDSLFCAKVIFSKQIYNNKLGQKIKILHLFVNMFLFIKNMFIFSRLFNKNNSKQKAYGIENNSSISYIVRRIIFLFKSVLKKGYLIKKFLLSQTKIVVERIIDRII